MSGPGTHKMGQVRALNGSREFMANALEDAARRVRAGEASAFLVTVLNDGGTCERTVHADEGTFTLFGATQLQLNDWCRHIFAEDRET